MAWTTKSSPLQMPATVANVASIVAGSLMILWGSATAGAAMGIRVASLIPRTVITMKLGDDVRGMLPGSIHGGLLARSTDEDHQQLLDLGWDYIDLVAVNLLRGLGLDLSLVGQGGSTQGCRGCSGQVSRWAQTASGSDRNVLSRVPAWLRTAAGITVSNTTPSSQR